MPCNPLDLQINLARIDAEQAGRRHAELCVASATVPIRAYFPTATAVIVGVDDWAVRQRGARLLAVLGSLGTLLWLFDAEDTNLAGLVADQGSAPASAAFAAPVDPGADARWEQLRAAAEDLFSQAVRHSSPALLGWREEPDDEDADADAFKVELPASLAVPNQRAVAEDAVYADDAVIGLPCDLEVDLTSRPEVRCKTHRTEDHVDAADAETALRRFYCDRGRRWTFLVHRTIHKEDHGPQIMTLSELAAEIRHWLDDDHAGGYDLGSAATSILTVRRYLTQDAMHVPLDINITPTSSSSALVWIADMDCPVLPPPEKIVGDAYAADGVTYLYTVIDLADTVARDTHNTGSPNQRPRA